MDSQPEDNQRSGASQRGNSRGRGGYRGRGNRNRPQNNRNREPSDNNPSVQNSGNENSNQNPEENVTNNSQNHHHHRNRNRGHHNQHHQHQHQDSGGNEEPSERANNRPEASSSRGRRGATTFSNTTRSNVQSFRGRSQRKKPDFLILHGEKTSFLKTMKNQSTNPITEAIIEDEPEEDKNEIKCPFCTLATPRITGVKLQAITNCSHIMCFECALRWYFISCQSSCPFCRQDLTKIIITSRLNVDHSNVQQLMYEYTHNTKLLSRLEEYSDDSGRTIGGTPVQESLIYIDMAKGPLPLPKSIREIINSLLNFQCKICLKRNPKNVFQLSTSYKTLEALAFINDHLRQEHRSLLCELCFLNLDDFVSEYQIFGENEFQLHRKYGTKTADKSAMVGPHPCCHLCDPVPTYYYNLDALELHCKTVHCSCYVCSQTIFFRDPNALRKHVEENHLLCTVCADSTGQIFGFASVPEYRRHIEQEHPNIELDLDSLSIRNRQPIIEFDPFNPNNADDDIDGEMTDRMANDQIDNLLRQSFQANQHEFFNASNVENYVTNFPSIEGIPNGDRLLPTTQTVHVFPGRSNAGRMGGRQTYEQDFPEMGPSTSAPTPSHSGRTMASVSGGIGGRRNVYNISRTFGGRSQARRVEFNPRPLSQVGINGQQHTEPTVSWQGKKPRSRDVPHILDDMIEGPIGSDIVSEPIYKPPTVSLIERPEPRINLTQNPQRPPKSEDFPSLAGPSAPSSSNHRVSKNNRNNNGQTNLVGWSKVTAPEPEVKDKKGKQGKNKQQQQQKNQSQASGSGSTSTGSTGLEKKVAKINLTDSSLFPALDIPEVSALQNIPTKKSTPKKRIAIPKKSGKR